MGAASVSVCVLDKAGSGTVPSSAVVLLFLLGLILTC